MGRGCGGIGEEVRRDIEVKNNLTIVRVKWGEDSEERGLQEPL